MAENNENKSKQTWSSTKILDCLAYFSIAFIAIALILRLIFKSTGNFTLANSFQTIGECLAYIICMWLAFYWTMKKRGNGWTKHNVAWLIVYLVSVITIVVIYIVALV